MIGNKTWYHTGDCGGCINFKPKKNHKQKGYGSCRKYIVRGTIKTSRKGCGDFDDQRNYNRTR